MGERTLTFRLAGINNQNFLMRDEQTGSWWQQVSGEAIRGPLAGTRLRRIPHDELTFATWRREEPGGRVLERDPAIVAKGRYASATWEERTAKLPVVTPPVEGDALPPRELIVGIVAGGASMAYPMSAIVARSPILDEVGGVPVAIVLSDDGRSVRAFDRRVDGRVLELARVPESRPLRMVDAEGTTWDFRGVAIEGALSGRELRRIDAQPEYWFDWRAYHSETGAHPP